MTFADHLQLYGAWMLGFISFCWLIATRNSLIETRYWVIGLQKRIEELEKKTAPNGK